MCEHKGASRHSPVLQSEYADVRTTKESQFDFRQGQDYFFFKAIQTDWGSVSPHSMGRVVLSPRMILAQREIYHAPPSSARVRNDKCCISTPLCYRVLCRNSFTLQGSTEMYYCDFFQDFNLDSVDSNQQIQ